MKTLFLPFLAALLFFTSCRQDDDINSLEKNTNAVDLYTAGAENNKACYWKNGQKIILAGGDGLYVHQIIVDNNNVYAMGGKTTEYLSSGPKHNYLWKNGIKYDLEQYLEGITPNAGSNFNNYINQSMVIENGNIYFTGNTINPASTSSQDRYIFCIWKNNVKTVVQTSDSPTHFGAFSIFNNTTYLPSSRRNVTLDPVTNTFTWEVGYYKNLQYSSLANDSGVYGFYSDNTGVYAHIKNVFTNLSYFKNLQNNTILSVPSNIDQSQISNFVWDGNDKYYIGTDFYYKNNVLVPVTEPNGYNKIGSFIIKDQNIYTTRYKEGGNLVKVFINNTEVQSIDIPPLLDPNVGGILSIYAD
ncbi:hypothetical protein [Chryseobacterium sp. OSA05B]|uniref:hypothetical protein n=1 Tax=Chryseobacterium sp. OSA05B TaxID=2862650 RepID=UPI001CBC90DC|nr:hypothetical protein [Chryseobacterium sp. OSA05B]